MAKRSQRRPMRYDKDQAGCIWGFINIFDFRHGRSTRRLLSNRQQTSRQIVGAEYSSSKLHMLTNSDGDSEEISDGEERDNVVADDAKASVKELMEEEMFTDQDHKKQMACADIKAKESDSERRGRMKKNCKRKSKSSRSSCDLKLDDIGNLGPENSCHQDSDEKTSKNLDMEVVMNELCQKIDQKSPSWVKYDCNNDLDIQSEQAYSVFHEKLIEAIKVFIDQRFTDGKHLIEGGKIDHSKEFIDALQTLSSNKELILKLLQDPNSMLVKQIEELEAVQLKKDRNSNSLARSNLLDGELKNSKPSLPVARKQHNFFRRKSKSHEKIVLKGDENCQAPNTIVILKPGPASMQISDTETKLSPSLQSHLETKVQTDRIASQFSFTQIKRKLKHAMGKERHSVPSNDVTHKIPCGRQNLGNSGKVFGGEKSGWNSPNRNHFYNERFARPTIGINNKDKSCKPKDTVPNLENEALDYSMPRVSNIYIEAKKHLSEMLSNGDQIEDFSSRKLPKTLGRILSLPEFTFTPIASPGKDKELSFVMAQKSLSPYDNVQIVNEDTLQLAQENHASHLDPKSESLIIESCISDNAEDTVQSCNSNSDVLDDLNCASAVEETLGSLRPEKSFERDVEIVETTEALVQEEIKVLDISAEQCSSSVIRDDQYSDLAEVCNEDESVQCLKLDSQEQDQLLSSPLTSPRSSSITKHVGDLDSVGERPERPSPVSVLEPLFTEDDISPSRIKSRHDEPSMQPLQIHFEEQLSSAANQEICARACLEDQESAFEYVEAVLLASDLNWEEFLVRWLSSNQILDASLFNEVELFSSRSCHDQKLLFDCTNEVLKEVCGCYLGYFPRVSFVKHNIRPIPRAMDLIHEVWEGVEWHLLPQPSPSSLDQIVRKDMEKAGTWMDLRFDVESIGIKVGEAVFEELLEDTILNFVNDGPEIDSSLLVDELIEIE